MNLAWISNPLWLIINALVAFRLTHLWITDTLPPLPTIRYRLRAKIEAAWDRKTIAARKAEHDGDVRWASRLEEAYAPARGMDAPPPLANLLDCYWCVGFWISLAVFLAASLIPLTVWLFLAVPLALSAAVGLIATRI